MEKRHGVLSHYIYRVGDNGGMPCSICGGRDTHEHPELKVYTGQGGQGGAVAAPRGTRFVTEWEMRQKSAADAYLRDRYAGEALSGLTTIRTNSGAPYWDAPDAARLAFTYADAMMAERAKRSGK